MYTAASMFSGAGGLDLGFAGGFRFLGTDYPDTGMRVVWANEISPAACRTYRSNFSTDIREGDIKDHLQSIPRADALIGGFPCQDISINGKMRGVDGARSGLYTYMASAVEATRPRVFVAENVGSLLLKRHADSLNRILDAFVSLGYEVSVNLFHAEEYGVPQTRERVFLVGTRKGERAFVPPAPLSAPPITAREALRDLEDRPRDPAIAHIWSNAKVSADQGNRRLVADRPGYTIRAECHGNIQYHYKLPRRISMREAARLQSFPDSFRFPCGLRETERQIGNAVPPVLAWHIAKAVKDVLDA